MKNEKKSNSDLEDIKNLLILLLIKFGANSKEISNCLGVDDSTIRKKFPMSKLKSKGSD